VHGNAVNPGSPEGLDPLADDPGEDASFVVGLHDPGRPFFGSMGQGSGTRRLGLDSTLKEVAIHCFQVGIS
jgi:hypothetical protein